jgi:SAM-dependent methyltransferase
MNPDDHTDTLDAVSFRDPAGKLFRFGGRWLRAVNPAGAADVGSFLDSRQARRLMANGSVIGTRQLSAAETEDVVRHPGVAGLFRDCPCALLLEHDGIEFPSFPYEWPPEMLYEAAALTLDLALRLQADGIGLKDATPYNVLFRGAEPVFVDFLSFECRRPGDSSWLPYAQFIRTFLLPLLVHKYFGVNPSHVFLTRRDGLEPEEVYRWCGPVQKLLPQVLSLVTLPTLLGRRLGRDGQTIYKRRESHDLEKSAFVLRSLLKGLRRSLTKLKPSPERRSEWSDYLTANNNYSARHQEIKRKFVQRALSDFRPQRVLDVGCNTGFLSSMAARTGARVIAIDSDPVVVGETWRQAREQDLDILPLVINLARPSPGVGWRNSECASFLERSHSAFDAVLMLAVIHHLLVTERIPLSEIVDLAAELTTDLLVVEFVAPQDSMFARLVRGREELHMDLNTAAFEACFRSRFEIAVMEHLEGTFRWLYVFRKRR